MRLLCSLLLLFYSSWMVAQTGKGLQLDVVQVEKGNVKEALYCYEHNWQAYRKAMLAKGFIYSYQLMQVATDSSHPVQLLLETVYKDSTPFAICDPRWQQIFKEVNPEATTPLNDKKPPEFRTIVMSRSREIIAEEEQLRQQK